MQPKDQKRAGFAHTPKRCVLALHPDAYSHCVRHNGRAVCWFIYGPGLQVIGRGQTAALAWFDAATKKPNAR